jgi:serine/threonine protein kinase
MLAWTIILSATDHAEELGWMHVYGFRLNEGRKVGVASIWQGPLTAESMGQLFSSIEIVARANLAPVGPSMWCQVKNSCLEEHHVWKIFDYRERNVADRRSPLYSMKFIPNCKAIVETTDLTLIRYPRIPGSHTPHIVGQWISVIKAVQRLHAENIVHGDLRASNIIFHKDNEEATIIDFDFVGVHEKQLYPKGFNVSINDGARQTRSAKEGRPLLFVHDWFAIGTMMGLCVLEDGNQEDWSEACRLLQKIDTSSQDVEKALGLLELCKGVPIESLNWKSEENPGTGSPERDPGKKS